MNASNESRISGPPSREEKDPPSLDPPVHLTGTGLGGEARSIGDHSVVCQQNPTMLARQSRALLSWQIDVASSVVVLVLLYGWISDLQSADPDTSSTRTHLSPSFVKNGFCLSPLFDDTHTVCSIFDIVGGIAFCAVAIYCLVFGKGGDVPAAQLLPVASYLFSHGYGHYVAATELIEAGSMDDNKMMDVKDLAILAAILSIGPFGGASCLVKAGTTSKGSANIAAGLVLSILVGIFAVFVRKPRFALLYINITILLCLALPRAFAIGYTSEKDISLRADTPLYNLHTATGLFVVTIIFVEPFYCDEFVAHIGGHLLFDVSLMVQSVVGVMVHAKSAKTAKDMTAKLD